MAWNGSDRALPRGAINPDLKKPGAPFLYARSTADGAGFEPQRNLNLHVYSLDGGGSIVYHGDPEVSSAIDGGGSVSKAAR